MKVIYIVNARMPTEKAHGYQIAKVCSELAHKGADVELWIPRRKNSITKSVFEYYSIPENIKVRSVASIDFFRIEKILGRFTYFLQAIGFALAVWAQKIPERSVIYTRNPEIAFLMKNKGCVVYNAHNWPEQPHALFCRFLSGVTGVVCNSHGTEQAFTSHGFSPTITIPNGVDLDAFTNSMPKQELRKTLNLPVDKTIAMYVGHLYAWKGIDVIMEAASELKNSNILFVLVGGTLKDIRKYAQICVEGQLENVVLIGHKEKNQVPRYIMAADIVLLPNIPSTIESERYASPIKMFEYMASGVPIIASDMPSLREVLNDKNATLVQAGNSEALVQAIQSYAYTSKSNEFMQKAQQAREHVRSYTWENHATRLLEFFKTLCAES